MASRTVSWIRRRCSRGVVRVLLSAYGGVVEAAVERGCKSEHVERDKRDYAWRGAIDVATSIVSR